MCMIVILISIFIFLTLKYCIKKKIRITTKHILKSMIYNRCFECITGVLHPHGWIQIIHVMPSKIDFISFVFICRDNYALESQIPYNGVQRLCKLRVIQSKTEELV